MSATEDDTLKRVVDGFQRLRVDYMIVGSYASNVHGRPRDSYDADILADLRIEHVPSFCQEFQKDFVVVPEAVADSVLHRAMFNLIPLSGIFKIDIIPLRDEPFDREEFQRRTEIEVFGARLNFATPEDVVLSKLRWYRKGGSVSGRQLDDARDVAAAQGRLLDLEYLRRWAAFLQVSVLLERVLGEAGFPAAN